MVYVYNGDADPPTEREIAREWKAYEKGNERAGKRYASDKVTIDARYDPKGGGRRW